MQTESHLEGGVHKGLVQVQSQTLLGGLVLDHPLLRQEFPLARYAHSLSSAGRGHVMRYTGQTDAHTHVFVMWHRMVHLLQHARRPVERGGGHRVQGGGLTWDKPLGGGGWVQSCGQGGGECGKSSRRTAETMTPSWWGCYRCMIPVEHAVIQGMQICSHTDGGACWLTGLPSLSVWVMTFWSWGTDSVLRSSSSLNVERADHFACEHVHWRL